LGIAQRHELLTTADELASRLGDAGQRIVDCRFDLMAPGAGRKSWIEAHIPAAVYADLDKDLSGPVRADTGRHPLPAVAAAEETFSRLGIDSDTRVVVYDDANGAIASRAWWLLRWLGHRHVTVLDGGFQTWCSRGLPLETGARNPTRRRFRANVRPGRVLSSQEIAANLDTLDRRPLIDARDAARFRGEVEPIDAKAGHIPGSRNLHFADCLRGDGTWLAPGELRERLEPLLGRPGSVPWAVMCGSGVTACHLAISGLLAGYSEPRVYVGSWSEWIRDPSRPIGAAPPVQSGQ
jgi:thiosulfate/3-mercaptopyruvate sulfurtransferase